jgi:hypothetical protein
MFIYHYTDDVKEKLIYEKNQYSQKTGIMCSDLVFEINF